MLWWQHLELSESGTRWRSDRRRYAGQDARCQTSNPARSGCLTAGCWRTWRVAVGEVNGLPALLLHRQATLEDVLAIVPDDAGMIAEMLLVAAPSKLAYARRQGFRLADG